MYERENVKLYNGFNYRIDRPLTRVNGSNYESSLSWIETHFHKIKWEKWKTWQNAHQTKITQLFRNRKTFRSLRNVYFTVIGMEKCTLLSNRNNSTLIVNKYIFSNRKITPFDNRKKSTFLVFINITVFSNRKNHSFQ